MRVILLIGLLFLYSIMCSMCLAAPTGPLHLVAQLDHAPVLGAEAELICDMEASANIQDISLTVTPLEGVKVTSGPATWSGSLTRGGKTQFRCTIKVTSPGNKEIDCKATYSIAGGSAGVQTVRWNVLFYSGPDSSQPTWRTDLISLQTPSYAPNACQPPAGTAPLVAHAQGAPPVLPPVDNADAPVPVQQRKTIATSGGTMQVSGTLRYEDRAPVEHALMLLFNGYQSDTPPLAQVYTDASGHFAFPPVPTPELWAFEVKGVTANRSYYSRDGHSVMVVGPGGGEDINRAYSASEAFSTRDGDVDVGTIVVSGDAWSVFRQMIKGFFWPHETMGDWTHMPGGCICEYPVNEGTETSHYHTWSHHIHLRSGDATDEVVVLHEFGHGVMNTMYGGWMPDHDCPDPHYFNRAPDTGCAWTEGFATWYAMAVRNNSSAFGQDVENLDSSTPDFDYGDMCEGRVAAALWDLCDDHVDGYDNANYGFRLVFDVLYGHRAGTYSAFRDLWQSFGLSMQPFYSASYQNTINYDHPPTVRSLPLVTMEEDEPIRVIDLWADFNDPDCPDSDMTFTVRSYPSRHVDPIIVGNRYLWIRPQHNYNGPDAVTVDCQSGPGFVSGMYDVSVAPVNDAPVFLPPATRASLENCSETLNLCDYTTDVDNVCGDLAYTIVSVSDPGIGATLDGAVLHINPAEHWHGTSVITLSCRDGEYMEISTITWTVDFYDHAPTWASIHHTSVNEDTPNQRLIDLWDYASDVDGPSSNLDYFLISSSHPEAGVSIYANRYVSVNPEPNWTGETVVEVQANDGSLSANTVFPITVLPVNDPPVFAALPNVDLAYGESRGHAVDLSAYVSDIDGPGPFTYALIGNTSPDSGARIADGHFVDIYPIAGWTGTAGLTIRVSDGLAMTTQTMWVTCASDLPPQFAGIPEQTLNEGATLTHCVDLWAYAYDPETPDSGLTFTIQSNSDENCTVGIEGDRYINISPFYSWYGVADVVVRCSDGTLYTDCTMRVKVNQINYPPTMSVLPEVTMPEDMPTYGAIDLWMYASDIETEVSGLTFTVTGNTNPACAATIEDNRLINIVPAPDWNGTAKITVTCSDGTNSVSDSFNVDVAAVDDPPSFGGLPEVTTPEDTPVVHAVDLWSYVSDPEQSPSELTFSISRVDHTEIGATIVDNRYLNISPTTNWSGWSKLDIDCSDGTSVSQCTTQVTVTPVNDPPALTPLPVVLTSVENTPAAHVLDLWSYASDVETSVDGLIFTISGSSSPECGVSIEANRYLNIDPSVDWSGSSLVIIRCSDGEDLAERATTVKVSHVNQPPRIAEFGNTTVAANTVTTGAIDLMGHTFDPDSPPADLTYSITANSQPSCGASVSSSGIDFSPTPGWTGVSTITARATDPDGLHADVTFQILVAPLSTTIAQARNIADGNFAFVEDKVVSAVFPDAFYIQDANRLSGIRVESMSPPDVGDRVIVSGSLFCTGDGERCIAPFEQQVIDSGSQPNALAMVIRALGGAAPDLFTSAVPTGGGMGAYNVGLLVKAFGRVNGVAGAKFFLDDGSGTLLKVTVPPGQMAPADRSWVTVTGISSSQGAVSGVMSMLRGTWINRGP